MKNIELLDLKRAIDNCGDLIGAKFAYALSKNVDLLKREMTALDSALKTTPEYNAYDNKRIELAKKYSKKAANGQSVTIPTGPNTFNYDIADQPSFDAEFAKLKEENKELVEKRDVQIADYVKLLEDEATEITFHKIHISDVPANITTAQLLGIGALIEDDEPTK